MKLVLPFVIFVILCAGSSIALAQPWSIEVFDSPTQIILWGSNPGDVVTFYDNGMSMDENDYFAQITLTDWDQVIDNPTIVHHLEHNGYGGITIGVNDGWVTQYYWVTPVPIL